MHVPQQTRKNRPQTTHSITKMRYKTFIPPNPNIYPNIFPFNSFSLSISFYIAPENKKRNQTTNTFLTQKNSAFIFTRTKHKQILINHTRSKQRNNNIRTVTQNPFNNSKKTNSKNYQLLEKSNFTSNSKNKYSQ